MKFPDPVVSAYATSFGCRAGTGLYLKKSSFGTVAAAAAGLIRRQKNQSAKTKTMSAIHPPTVPPTMAPKLEFVVEGAVVAVGVGVILVLLVDWDELEAPDEGVGVTESEVAVGVLVANAPTPVSIGVGFIV